MTAISASRRSRTTDAKSQKETWHDDAQGCLRCPLLVIAAIALHNRLVAKGHNRRHSDAKYQWPRILLATLISRG
jgi:hypothetical protein